jgi:hypothetical protein
MDLTLIITIILALPAITIGILAYRRSAKADERIQEAGTVGAVYEGLDNIIQRQQEEIADLRQRLSKLDALEDGIRTLKRRVDLLERFIIAEGLIAPKNTNGMP